MMYDRFARDLSESLFDSVYRDLYAAGSREQAAIWRARGRRGYHVKEAQEALTGFCNGKLSLGDALDRIRACHRP